MAVTYPNNVKAARMTAVRDLMDAGSGAGKLEIGTAGMAAVLATIPLSDPAGTISAGVLTLSGFPKSDTADASGTAAAARIRDSDNNDVITGLTVGTSGTDIVLDSVNITTGQTVTINSAVFNHA
ncbi:MAG: hypothetical protein GY848_05475 [Methyloversatilis sp.]|nr:hypothetical protein [Methyloversatilis sp.]